MLEVARQLARRLVVKGLLENFLAIDHPERAQEQCDGGTAAYCRPSMLQAIQEQMQIQAADILHHGVVEFSQVTGRRGIPRKRLKSEGAAEVRQVGAGQKDRLRIRQLRQRLRRSMLLRIRHRSHVERHQSRIWRYVLKQRELDFHGMIADKLLLDGAKLRVR